MRVGSIVRVPFGRQALDGVVVGLAEHTELAPERLVAPTGVREDDVPEDLVELALWMATEYCSTPARSLQLVLPPRGQAAHGAVGVPHRRAARRRAAERQPARAARRAADARHRAAARRCGAWRRAGWSRSRTASAAARRAPTSSRAPPVALTADQEAAIAAVERGGVASAARRDRLGQDRGLPARRRRGARARRGRDRARARDRAHAADRRALPGALRRHRRAAALRARRGRALRRVAAPAHGRGADRRRPALGRVRAGRRPRAGRRRRGARRLLQARGRPALRRAHRRRRARAPRRRAAARRHRDAAPGDLARAAAPAAPDRVDARPLPPVRVLDMRGARHPLHPETRRALASARKSIVLLNRRGWSNFLTCRSCGKTWECPNCEVALVLHRAENAIACHHCGHRERVPERCDACGSLSVARHGAGTERDRARAARGPRRARLPARRRHRRAPRTPCPSCWRASAPRRRGCCSAPRWSPRATTSPTSRSASCSTPTRRCASPTSAPRSARSR